MPPVEKIVQEMRQSPSNIRFKDALKVCEHYFGPPRISGSHIRFQTPWRDMPSINMQSDKGSAKPYQIRQLIKALNRLDR